MRRRTGLQNGIFLAAGAYLVYTGYQLLKDLPNMERNRIVFIIASIVFIIVGIGVAIRSILGFLAPKEEGDSSAKDTKGTGSAEEELSEAKEPELTEAEPENFEEQDLEGQDSKEPDSEEQDLEGQDFEERDLEGQDSKGQNPEEPDSEEQ